MKYNLFLLLHFDAKQDALGLITTTYFIPNVFLFYISINCDQLGVSGAFISELRP